jgi:hypothetical protein
MTRLVAIFAALALGGVAAVVVLIASGHNHPANVKAPSPAAAANTRATGTAGIASTTGPGTAAATTNSAAGTRTTETTATTGTTAGATGTTSTNANGCVFPAGGASNVINNNGVQECACGGGILVAKDTTCSFARNVKQAYDHTAGTSQPEATVVAYSPATGRSYTMRCVVNGQLSSGMYAVTCAGGHGANLSFSAP